MQDAINLILGISVTPALAAWAIWKLIGRRRAVGLPAVVPCTVLAIAILANPVVNVALESWHMGAKAEDMRRYAGQPRAVFLAQFGKPDSGGSSAAESGPMAYAAPCLFLYWRQQVIVHVDGADMVGYAHVGG